MQFDEMPSFLDLDTGQVETVSFELLRDAEESTDDDEPDEAGSHDDEWELAKRILFTDRFVKLPTKFDVNEWEIMREFSESIESKAIRDHSRRRSVPLLQRHRA